MSFFLHFIRNYRLASIAHNFLFSFLFLLFGHFNLFLSMKKRRRRRRRNQYCGKLTCSHMSDMFSKNDEQQIHGVTFLAMGPLFTRSRNDLQLFHQPSRGCLALTNRLKLSGQRLPETAECFIKIFCLCQRSTIGEGNFDKLGPGELSTEMWQELK